MRVLIADDEPLARRGLEQLLDSHADCAIVASCRNGAETIRALQTQHPDLALLDIQMPLLNGFDVLRHLGRCAPVVVFVTAYDEFAIRAFEARALDYLLKPVSQQRFDQALERVREQLRARRAFQQLQPLTVSTSTAELVLDQTEIDWIEAEDYCATIHANGKRYTVRESLASFEQKLDSQRFVRVHRSAIVRLSAIRELRADSAVVLRDGTTVPLSRRRRERVLALIRAPFTAPA